MTRVTPSRRIKSGSAFLHALLPATLLSGDKLMGRCRQIKASWTLSPMCKAAVLELPRPSADLM